MTSTMLPRDQWRLVNMIYGQMVLRQNRQASLLLRWSGTSRDDLVALEAAGLVRANARLNPSVPGLTDPVSLADANTVLALVEVTLTPSGVAWYRRNPFNRAVCASAQHAAQSPAPLGKIIAFRGVDLAALVAVADAGLVSVTPAIDGAAPLTVTALRDPNQAWRISTTAAGRYVLAA